MIEHGTRARYHKGCRCQPCTEANRVYYHTWKNRDVLRWSPAPLQPLLERLSTTIGTPVDQITVDQIAQHCGVAHRTAQRWKQTGIIPGKANGANLDDIATRIGWHPAAIWGTDWYIQQARTA